MNTRHLPLLGLALSAVIFASPARGISVEEKRKRNAQLDINGDQMLSKEEVKLGLLHLMHPEKVNLPKIKKDGKLPAEVKTDEALEERYIIFRQTVLPPPPYALNAVAPSEFGLDQVFLPGADPVAEALKPYTTKWDIKLRRTTDDLKKPMKDGYEQGALFSYGYNYLTKEDQWTARGVLAISYSAMQNRKYDQLARERVDGKANLPQFTPPEAAFVRSIDGLFTLEFDKVNTGGSTKGEVDNLKFGLHLIADLFTGQTAAQENRRIAESGGRPQDTKDAFLESVIADLSAMWSTDSNFERNVPSVQLDLTPNFGLPGSHSYGYPFGNENHRGPVGFRWVVTGHVEVGTVQETGQTGPNFRTDNFARAGGSGVLDVLVLPDLLEDRLSLQAKYLYYKSLMSDVRSSHLFHASAQYVLPIGSGLHKNLPSGARGGRDILATLRVEYQNGEIPLTLEKDESLLIGLGVYF